MAYCLEKNIFPIKGHALKCVQYMLTQQSKCQLLET